MATEKVEISTYWNGRPCGDRLTHAERGSRRYFADVEAAKDRLEPYLHEFADCPRWAGKDVLEIGCGLGTDTARFARAGARITAVDLSEVAVELTRAHLDSEGLEGTVEQADAEELPFADAAFDLVYSWGVLHHTPDTGQSIREVARVLRSGGEARVMLYNSRSLFALGVWARRGPLAGRAISLSTALATGLESPGTKAFTRAQVAALFEPFREVEIDTVATPYDRRVAGPLASALPSLGWNHLVRARR